MDKGTDVYTYLTNFSTQRKATIPERTPRPRKFIRIIHHMYNITFFIFKSFFVPHLFVTAPTVLVAGKCLKVPMREILDPGFSFKISKS